MTFRLDVTESHTSGRGIVVAGVVEGGPVAVDQKVWVRPPSGNDQPVLVAGITARGGSQRRADPGQEAALLLHGVKPLVLGPDRGIPPGSVLEGSAVEPDEPPEATDLDELTLAARPTALPLLLLPLRVETSFEGTTLRIRAFPDQVHVDSFDPRLTATEVAAGRSYLGARDEGTPRPEALADLETTLGAARAAVVAERADAQGEAGLRAEAAGALDRRAVARGLPHKLIAHGRSGSRTFTAEGRPIPPEVPVAPADGDDAPPGAGGPLDWMVDYAAAEQIGLALTMQLDDAASTDGLDRLYVFGVDADADGHGRFAELVHAHARTDGAATLAPLTPTKGSPQEPPGWGPASSGDTGLGRLTRALGLTEDLTLTRAPAADAGTLAPDLALILWEAALRPALAELYGARPEVLERAREIFVHQIQPLGPYATLQLGDQPYATAPVLARRPKSGDPVLGAVGDAIRTALPTVAASAETTRADARTRDAYPWMLETLQRSPIGQQWRLRTLTAAEAYLTPLARAAGSAPATEVADALFRALRSGRDLLAELELHVDADSRVFSAIGDSPTPRVCGPLVADGAAEDRTGTPVADAGIERLLTDERFWGLRMEQVRRERQDRDTEPEPLLRLLAENAVLQTLADLAVAEGLAGEDGELAAALRPGAAYLPGKAAHLRVRLAAAAESAVDGNLLDLTRALPPRTRQGSTRMRHLQELCAALQRVDAAAASGVHAAFAAVLDCAATRADAWLVAEAEDALAAERKAGRDGVALGAWGVLQDVRPAAGQRPTRHGSAPSQELATTLGLLDRARRGLAGTGLAAAVRADLSGPRVAEARDILALLTHRPVDAALSRRVAEKLNAAGQGRAMSDLAEALPAPGGSATDCDGLAFLEQDDLASLPGVDAADVPLLTEIQATLRAAMDALGELHLADGATALANRRVEAAQSTLDALSAGTPPPSDMSALEPATTGTTLEFTVAACVGATEKPAGARDLRAALAPGLAVLAERLCGPLKGMVYPVGEDEVALEALGLSTLSLAYLAAPGTDAARRVKSYARCALDLPEDAVIELDLAAHATLWAAGRVAALLREARALTAEDLPEDADVAPDGRATEQTRDSAMTRLRKLADALPDAGAATPADAAHLFAAGLIPAPEVALVPAAVDVVRDRLDGATSATDDLEALQELLADMPATPALLAADAVPWEDGALLQGAAPAELGVWLEESQAVRSRLGPVADLLLGSPEAPVKAAQWPGTPRPTRHPVDWIGAELREDDVYAARSSLVSVGTDMTAGTAFCGLLLDSWQEVVPDAEVTAGVVVDSPSPPARAPQLMVLAVPGGDGEEWSPRNVVDTIDRTVATAQARTVGLGSLPAPTSQNGALGNLGQLLPVGAVRPADTALTRAACEPTTEG